MRLKTKTTFMLKSALLGAAILGALSLAGAAQAAPINWYFYNTANNAIATGTVRGPETFKSDQGFQPLPVTTSAFVYDSSKTSSTQYYSSTSLYNKATDNGLTATKNEIGLGLNIPGSVGNDSSHEIVPGSFIQIDISNLTKPPLTSFDLTFQGASVTDNNRGKAGRNDEYEVFGTNTPGDKLTGSLSSKAKSLAKGATQAVASSTSGFQAGDINVDKALNYKYLDITALTVIYSGHTYKSDILLNKLDGTVANSALVPEPGSLALLGTGLLGLGLVMRRRRRKA